MELGESLELLNRYAAVAATEDSTVLPVFFWFLSSGHVVGWA